VSKPGRSAGPCAFSRTVAAEIENALPLIAAIPGEPGFERNVAQLEMIPFGKSTKPFTLQVKFSISGKRSPPKIAPWAVPIESATKVASLGPSKL